MRIVVDCANGAASRFTPQLLERLGAEVVAINADPDGSNINVGCGALHPEVVAERWSRRAPMRGSRTTATRTGRCSPTPTGDVIDGDQVLAACAVAMKERGALVGDAVVATVMSNLGFHRAMDALGIRVISAPVGDRYVLEQMLEHEVALGGEQSGHVIFRDDATTGDGLDHGRAVPLAGRGGGVPVGGARGGDAPLPAGPRERRGARTRRGSSRREEVWDAVRAGEAELDGAGRVLVRASGTEPLVRVMVEAETEELAQATRRGGGRAGRRGIRLRGFPRLRHPWRSLLPSMTSCAASWATSAPTERSRSSSRDSDVSSTVATTPPAWRRSTVGSRS